MNLERRPPPQKMDQIAILNFERLRVIAQELLRLDSVINDRLEGIKLIIIPGKLQHKKYLQDREKYYENIKQPVPPLDVMEEKKLEEVGLDYLEKLRDFCNETNTFFRNKTREISQVNTVCYMRYRGGSFFVGRLELMEELKRIKSLFNSVLQKFKRLVSTLEKRNLLKNFVIYIGSINIAEIK